MEDKVELVETNNLTRKQNIILYFFIYAFLGWILETAFCILTTGVFTKRGFLYGPICPIYGFGAILLIESLKNIKTNTVSPSMTLTPLAKYSRKILCWDDSIYNI